MERFTAAFPLLLVSILAALSFWLERTDGARFESPLQKALHAHYLDQAVDLERGDLHRVQEAAADHGVHVCVGTIERPADRAPAVAIL